MTKAYTSVLNEFGTVAEVYDFVGRSLAGQIPKSVVIVVHLDVPMKSGCVYGIYGLGAPWFNKLISVLGLNPVGRRFDLTEDGRLHYYFDTTFRLFKGSVYDFAGGQISEWIAKSVEKMFSIHNIYTIALNHAKVPMGTAMVFNRLSQAPEFKDLDLLVHEASRRLFHIIEKNKRELKVPAIKDEFIENMLGNISHEIRTPLNGILGMLEVAHMGNLSNDVVDVSVFDEAWSNARVLTRNIESLVLASELVTQSISLRQVIHPAQAFVQLVKKVVKRQSQFNPSRQISLNIAPFIVGFLHYDEHRLEYLIDELVVNALKFSGLSVIVEVSMADCLQVTVSDCGIGLSDNEIDVIFEHFARVPTLNRVYRGMGLGLYNCNQLAILHQGSVKMNSILTKGSQVTLSLPLVCQSRLSVSN